MLTKKTFSCHLNSLVTYGMPLRYCIFLCFLFSCWLATPSGEGIQSLKAFVEQKEAQVTEVAIAAQEAWTNRQELVESCTCARHRCSNEMSAETQCTQQLPTPDICEKCEGSMVDFTSVSVDLAPGTDPGNFSSGVSGSMIVLTSDLQ